MLDICNFIAFYDPQGDDGYPKSTGVAEQQRLEVATRGSGLAAER